MSTERPWSTDLDLDDCLVSIITPTHDRVDLLCEAVRSVRAQDHRPIEQIVVGDACPALDAAAPLLREIDPDLRIYNLSPDLPRPSYGPARIAWVRNQGIARARGAVIGHLDDDNSFDPDHVSSLLAALARQPGAASASSYRKLLIDGKEPWLLPCHPWAPGVETGKHVWAAYHRMGIYTEGSHLMRDRVTFSEERDCTVDTNELLVRREVHERHPFPTTFTDRQRAEEMGEDDVFCETLYRAGYRISASGRFSLNFRVGGRFTRQLMERVEAEGTDAAGG